GPNTFDIAVSGMNQPGFVRPLVGAGAVVDAAGNSSADVVEGDNSVYYSAGLSTLVVDDDGFASETDCDSPFPAYATIQSAINAAANGNTIKVCPGTYAENLIVDKKLTLQGPNFGIAGNGVRGPEAVITTPTSDPTDEDNFIVGIKASGVIFDGFTVDGDNTSLPASAYHFNGATIDATVGVDSLDASNKGFWSSPGFGHNDPHVTVSHNIVQNLGEMGIAVNGNNAAGNQNSTVANNKIDNIPGIVYGGAMYLGNNGWTDAIDNVITRVSLGIVVENMSSASTSGTATISGNNISSRGLGIRPNLAYSYSSTILQVANNTISSYLETSTGVSPASKWRGIRIESWNAGVPLTVSGNTIAPDRSALQTAGYTRVDGIWLTNTYSTSNLISITGNTISNTLRGIAHTIPGTPTVTGNALYNNDVGVYVGHDVQFGNTTESYATGGISATQNNLVGNGTGIVKDTSAGLPPDTGGTVIGTVTANNNYWGSAYGPGPIASGLGDPVSANVNYTPFETAALGCAPAVAYPTVTVEQAGSDPSATSPIHFTVTFSAPVTGLNGSKFRLSGTAGATTATVRSGTGAGPYDVEVSGMSGSGTVILDLYSGGGVTSSGVPSVASTSTDNTVTFDNTPPTVTSITRADSNPTNAVSVDFNVTFSESVNNVDLGDFSLSPTVTGATLTTISGSGANYTVTVNTGTGDGSLGLSIPAGSDIADAALNTLGGLPFTTGDTYTIDKTGPAPVVAAVNDPDSASPVDFTVDFGETTTGFDPTDVTIGGTANPTGFTISGTGPYTISVTGMNQSGT